ncbi:uncharacterized protein LOC128738860 [Sabethes cyaneus]|uniref:uncharacterized protein LOC128738860 n=1 Tax=Sabethes cyaneus TaxID=53552 RepID=UPI00221E2A04|nr:uncharacterized protein LOC128738860 [Sabethes cyaneus]
MDKLLRFFIKFHGYCIAVATSVLTVLFTSIFTSHMQQASWEELYDLRYTGIPALVFGIAWMVVNSLLIIGIYQERKTFLYPFTILFLFELLLVILRDIYLIANDFAWYKSVFFNFSLPFLLFIIPYVIFTMLALRRLFDVDPITRTNDSFVRFDRNPSADADRLNGVVALG